MGRLAGRPHKEMSSRANIRVTLTTTTFRITFRESNFTPFRAQSEAEWRSKHKSRVVVVVILALSMKIQSGVHLHNGSSPLIGAGAVIQRRRPGSTQMGHLNEISRSLLSELISEGQVNESGSEDIN